MFLLEGVEPAVLDAPSRPLDTMDSDRHWRVTVYRLDLETRLMHPVVTSRGERLQTTGPWARAVFALVAVLERRVGGAVHDAIGPAPARWGYSLTAWRLPE